MSTSSRRLAGLLVAIVVIGVLVGLYIALYLTSSPGSASAAATRTSAGTVQLYMATVAAAEPNDPHPTWVSYYVVDSGSRHWQHATTFELPANTLVHVTVYQYDGQSGLRNPFISQATGIVAGSFTLNGKPMQTIDPDAASHIFAIPQIGVSVPLYGIPDDAKNPCDNAPCNLSQDHATVSFTFRTPGEGLYRWQCFVPCAAGFIDGFGGPMQTIGYMDGYIKVV
ncbi:MAG TPA: hypothetical protein VMU39_05930 [Solirubrobacteraceae bacterium]|nr:hypothetical protein [Solirubrobacteraceae bacterium]